MTPRNSPPKNQAPGRNLVSLLGWILIFTLAYSQAPLYTSNQNHYFLHGMADAGMGYLEEDWQANTLDPTPVFSGLVNLSERILGWDPVFYLYYAILAGIYLYSLLGIANLIYGIGKRRSKRLVFLAALVGLHSAGVRFLITTSLGPEWNYLLDGGVAGQRLLGSVLQPSTFGVLLMLSIYLFLRGDPFWAGLCVVLVASVHPTYLLSGALLTAVYMGVTIWERKNPRRALILGGGILLGVAPILGHAYLTFGATSPETAAKARDILVDFRIPHHAIPEVWFNASVVVKIGFFLAALYLLIRKRDGQSRAPAMQLGHILFWPTVSAAALTIVQVWSGSDTLALLFPWRVSTIIVPLSVSVIAGWLVVVLPSWRALLPLSLILGLALATAGVGKYWINLRAKLNDEDQPVMAYVNMTKSAGETYLIPTKIQEFRLETGAPAYVDFKTIPFKDVEVLEWRRRVRLADRFYRAPNKQVACPILDQLRTQEGVTEAILPREHPGRDCPAVQARYQDDHYGVFTLGVP